MKFRAVVMSVTAANAMLLCGLAVAQVSHHQPPQFIATSEVLFHGNSGSPGPFLVWNGGTGVLSANAIGILLRPPNPPGAIYHQVVDIYYDEAGNKLETKSYTHAIDADCQPGKRQQDRLVQDDGKGNVRFVDARPPSEPVTGQKPVAAEATADPVQVAQK